jgi:hypothetical protein
MEGTQPLQELPQRELYRRFQMGRYVSGKFRPKIRPFELISLTRSLL